MSLNVLESVKHVFSVKMNFYFDAFPINMYKKTQLPPGGFLSCGLKLYNIRQVEEKTLHIAAQLQDSSLTAIFA